jgi:hypothetical protein
MTIKAQVSTFGALLLFQSQIEATDFGGKEMRLTPTFIPEVLAVVLC